MDIKERKQAVIEAAAQHICDGMSPTDAKRINEDDGWSFDRDDIMYTGITLSKLDMDKAIEYGFRLALNRGHVLSKESRWYFQVAGCDKYQGQIEFVLTGTAKDDGTSHSYLYESIDELLNACKPLDNWIVSDGIAAQQ